MPSAFQVHNAYGRRFDDGHSLYHFLLVHFRTGTIEVANNSGHTSFVAHCSSKMHRFLGVVFGKALAARNQRGPLRSQLIVLLTLFPDDGLLVSEEGRRASHVAELRIYGETSCLPSSHQMWQMIAECSCG